MENSGQIYSAAANMISKLEKEPYFLLQVFRGATKMTNSYQRQKFLMAIDAIVDQDVEEFNEEEEVVEGSDDAVKNNSSPRTALSFDQVSQASVALSTATIESSAWKNGFSEVSRGDNYSHVYQILREARLRISNTVDEFVSSVNNSRFTRLQIDQLVEKFLTVLVIGGENSSSWQETRRQLEFGLEKFVNRNISKQRDNLFYQVDEIATQVIFDQQKRRDDDEDSSDEDDELVFAKRPESFGGSLFLN